MTRLAAAVLAVVLVGGGAASGCDEPDASPDAGPPATTAVPAISAAAAPAEIDPRDALALVREIAEARHGDQDSIDDRYARVRASWVGRRLRWEASYSRALCRSASWCAVAVFDRLGTPGALNQGWLPLLHMSEAEHARMREACPGTASCGAVFEGTLRTFSLTSVEPTSLDFEDVELVRTLPDVPTFGARDTGRR